MDEHTDILKKNEEIAKKISKIEKSLPSFLNAKDLFENLLVQIQEEFSIPFVWISVATETDFTSLIQLLRASQTIKERLNIIDRATFLAVIGESTKPMLANNDLKPLYKLLPRKKKFFVKSIAIAPMIVNGEIIGSINLGDSSNLRYQPGMDTGLLEKLVWECIFLPVELHDLRKGSFKAVEGWREAMPAQGRKLDPRDFQRSTFSASARDCRGRICIQVIQYRRNPIIHQPLYLLSVLHRQCSRQDISGIGKTHVSD